MTKPLVVVESPTKIRTLKKYLGKQYNIAATVGHIKDLPQKEIGINIDDGFKPKYTNIPGKQKVIRSLKQAAGDSKDIYLAPDPDREGEAIAWHTAEILKKKDRKFYRVLFHELDGFLNRGSRRDGDGISRHSSGYKHEKNNLTAWGVSQQRRYGGSFAQNTPTQRPRHLETGMSKEEDTNLKIRQEGSGLQPDL